MEIIEGIAILGAMAWAPPILSMIKSRLTKPEIRIISNQSAEIGFTLLGPIFNVYLAFSVKNHDIVVSGFKVRITHEGGEKKVFEWKGIKQQLLKMTTPDGSVTPYEKENSVLAIKLNQKEIEERNIKCRETAFINGREGYDAKAIKRMIYLKDQGTFDKVDFLKSPEMMDLYAYIKQAFPWKAGVYCAVIELESPEPFYLIDNKYEFTLTPIDIEVLSKNKEKIESHYESYLEENGSQDKAEIFLDWRYPVLRKL